MYFTGKGDNGKTTVVSKRFYKNNLIFEVLGELDELNSLIGLAKNYLPKKYKRNLTEIQNDIFIIQANVAYFLYKRMKPPTLNRKKIQDWEKKIKEIESKIKHQSYFIIYGEEKNSAWFDYLRAVVRRVERRVVKFNKKYKLPPEILSYLNRLSSYFYALARFICYNKHIKEVEPWY